MTLQGINNIHGSDGFASSVLCVGNGVSDDILEKDLENTTSLLIDQSTDTFHTTTTGKAADCRLGNTLDVVSEDLAMALGSSLSEALASFTSAGHGDGLWRVRVSVLSSAREKAKRCRETEETGPNEFRRELILSGLYTFMGFDLNRPF